MLDPQIAIGLRSKGRDVLSIQKDHAELMGLDDAVVLDRLSM